MPSLVAKTVRGRKYWQIVESRRVNGQPRSFVVAHLGRPETLLARLQAGPAAARFRSVAHGAVAALWARAQALDVAGLIDAHVRRDRRGRLPRRDGLTPGQSLVLAMVARACRPLSKRAFAAWAQGTSLGRLAGVDVARLTSQHFWDQMAAVPAASLPAIEEAVVQRVVAQEHVAPDTFFYDTTNFFTFIDSTNARPTLPRRGHNKQQRHDLRQLGLALVVTRDGQLPLFHLLYEGDRPDVRTFPEVLTSVRTRLERVFGAAAPVTLVYDKGNVSRATQGQVSAQALHYVTSLVPTQHAAVVAEALPRLAPVTLPTGEVVQAYRTRRELWGQLRTLVVLRSERLRAGQIRGLHQHLAKRMRGLAAITAGLEAPRGGRGSRAGLEQRVADLRRGQHMRRLLHIDIVQERGRWRLASWVEAAEYRRLTEEHFGLQLLMTDRDDLPTADLILAYRGQSRAERAFREMKDPEGCALRPQYHWTDQKLQVHALCCVLSYLLLKLLERQARGAGLPWRSPRRLLRALEAIREVVVIESGPRGRPRVRRQLEDLDPEVTQLAACFGLLSPGTAVVTTGPPG
ncbi:MAG: IS1634 family transposase [Armatimonadota bacterium]|nr:IS1634 family transposase [Armatimonadota bacterium]MDR7577143.1 IS1634 family transposase [Armatimonadota bacterium]